MVSSFEEEETLNNISNNILGKQIYSRMLMTPIKNTELIVIVFDIKPEDVDKKQPRKSGRFNLFSSSNHDQTIANNLKKNLFTNAKKSEAIYQVSHDHQSERKLSILSVKQLFSLKSSK